MRVIDAAQRPRCGTPWGVKRLVLALLVLSACKQQDAALLVTITGAFRIPADADKLSMDVLDAATKQVIVHKDWCVTTTAACPTALPPQPGGLSQTVTLVESAGDHPHVKINFTLDQNALCVGQGTNLADFQDGLTGQVSIVMSRPCQ